MRNAIEWNHLNNIRWRHEQTDTERRKELCKTRIMLSKLVIPSNWNVFHRVNDGCVVRPVNASVTAKQASNMLVLLCSLGLLFTAIITSTLSTTVTGQVMLLMMTVTIKLTSSEMFSVSTCMVAFESLLVMFIKSVESESLVMFRESGKMGTFSVRMVSFALFHQHLSNVQMLATQLFPYSNWSIFPCEVQLFLVDHLVN